MWIEEQSNGRLRYVERIKDPYTGKKRRVYEQIEKNTLQARKKAAVALQMQINEILNTKPVNDKITFGEVYKDFYDEWSLGVKQSTVYSTSHIDKMICEKIPADYLIVKIDRRFLQKLFNQLLIDGRSHNYVKKVKWKLNQIIVMMVATAKQSKSYIYRLSLICLMGRLSVIPSASVLLMIWCKR